MKRVFFCGLIIIFFISLPSHFHSAETKGIKVIVKDMYGRKVELYKESYALLIGVSRYTSGWPNLESVPDEINRIETALETQGFNVKKVLNPNSDQLSDAFEEFIDKYGFDRNNQLLIFFSGHGYTRNKGKKGYIVPADAPDPRSDEKGFLRKAVGMGHIITWAREIESKHVLFVFDSCFSGTIFKTRSLPKHPPHISDVTSRPVRQFITAGSAGEEVPALSVFVPSFIRALRGEGDLDGDGYVTGTELGIYLHKKVLTYETGQTPQYGKIKDPDLDEGDFVFQLGKSIGSTPSYLAAEKKRLAKEREEIEHDRLELEQIKAQNEERKRLEEERKRLGQEKEKLKISRLPKTELPQVDGKRVLSNHQIGILKDDQKQRLKRTMDYYKKKNINRPIPELAAIPSLFLVERRTKSLKIRVPSISNEAKEVYKTFIKKKLGIDKISFVRLPFADVHIAIEKGVIDGVVTDYKKAIEDLKRAFPQGVLLYFGS
jgi:Caspase domain